MFDLLEFSFPWRFHNDHVYKRKTWNKRMWFQIDVISILMNRNPETSWELKKQKRIELIEISLYVDWICILIIKRDYWTNTSDFDATECAFNQPCVALVEMLDVRSIFWFVMTSIIRLRIWIFYLNSILWCSITVGQMIGS